MSNAQEFNVFSWLSAYLQTQVNHTEIQQVINFCLMWNLFESKICNFSASPARIIDAVAQLPAEKRQQVAPFQSSLEYFRNRYFPNGQQSHLFADLNFRQADNEPLVRSVLDGSANDPTTIMQCLLLIIWRFRNNLFHGMKALSNLAEQNENFKHANTVLANFLDLES